ncbi:MAG: hypothetical protein U5K69_22060 [Balneolaceae bacterium]|nr:hypothetical protein [Balneolaceae bacterium]
MRRIQRGELVLLTEVNPEEEAYFGRGYSTGLDELDIDLLSTAVAVVIITTGKKCNEE